MFYDEARNTFQTGDIVAVSRDRLKSWKDIPGHITRLFTKSEYSHVALVWVFAGRVFLIESVKPLVRIIPLSNLAERGFYHIPVGKDFSYEEVEYLMSMVGKSEYSTLQAVTAYLKRLKLGADKRSQCAELAIVARRLSGVDLGDVATPSSIVKTLLEQGATMRYIKQA